MIVKNKTELRGEIEVSSSKNAILPILAASLLSDDELIINNVPVINDVSIITQLIKSLGVKVKEENRTLVFSGGAGNNNPP
ncbi:MAG: UDP-N-acetylglucosamine 1-carboxyvinyltransferase, partial [Syntrophomonas sp.]